MRNIIFGMIGTVMLGYSVLICFCIYGIQLREHEMNNRISQVVAANLEAYYVPDFLREEGYADKLPGIEQRVRNQVNQELEACSTFDSEIHSQVTCLDLDKGILSVVVEESYGIPTGNTMTRQYSRTAIMERNERPIRRGEAEHDL